MRVQQRIREANGCAEVLQTDLSRPEQVDALFRKAECAFGAIDILVNNAGIGLGATVLETRTQDLRLLFEVNFFALHSLCRQALADMGKRRRGIIVNVTSAAARSGCPRVSAYSASKGAVHAYTQSLRLEAAPLGVSVVECLPISVRTGFFENVRGKKYLPSGVVQTPQKVAKTLLRALSQKNPPAEVLPFKPIRIAFVLEALIPQLFYLFSRRMLLHDEDYTLVPVSGGETHGNEG